MNARRTTSVDDVIEVFRVAMGHERKLAEREALTLLNEVMRAWTQGELTRLAAK